MILQITLWHDFLGGDSKEVLYISPQELETGADIASHFRDAERALFSPFTAAYVDDRTVEISWQGKSRRYSVLEDGNFHTDTLTLRSNPVRIEGDEYTSDHEVEVYVKLLPHIMPLWDILKVTRSDETVMIPRNCLDSGSRLGNITITDKKYDWLEGIMVRDIESSRLTLRLEGSEAKEISLDCIETPEVETEGLTFSLVSHTTIINEWDMMEEKAMKIRVNTQYLKEAETDSEAAYLLAESVQEQYPEALEVIAHYMMAAYKLGSPEAEEWLRDYHSDDGRFDAYC